MELLNIRNLSITYKMKSKNIMAVDDISLSINEGESMGIVGESGSGKSTLALGVLRLLPDNMAGITGSIKFLGKEMTELSEQELREIRWKKLSVVFQKSMNSLSPVHRIGRQIEDIYRVHDSKTPKAEVKGKIIKLFDMVNLSERVYDLYPHELSGGMLQRVSIALSLLHEPNLVIFDEATTALDVVTQGQILNEIKKLEKSMNVTRIMITHDVSVVATSCKKVAVMYAGRLMEYGDVDTVLTNPAHPYTQGLLKSFPSLRGERVNLRGIKGSLPDLSEINEGCVFARRCEKAKEICCRKRPGNIVLSDKQTAACFLYGGGM